MKKQIEITNLEELAQELSEVKTDMRLMRSMSESFPSLGAVIEADGLEMNYYRAKQTFSMFYDKFQHLEGKLDKAITRIHK